MTDLGPMVPCPADPNGRHRFDGIGLTSAEDDRASLTWLCRHCGALRQVTGFGPLYEVGSKDTMTGDEIEALFHEEWESR